MGNNIPFNSSINSELLKIVDGYQNKIFDIIYNLFQDKQIGELESKLLIIICMIGKETFHGYLINLKSIERQIDAMTDENTVLAAYEFACAVGLYNIFLRFSIQNKLQNIIDISIEQVLSDFVNIFNDASVSYYIKELMKESFNEFDKIDDFRDLIIAQMMQFGEILLHRKVKILDENIFEKAVSLKPLTEEEWTLYSEFFKNSMQWIFFLLEYWSKMGESIKLFLQKKDFKDISVEELIESIKFL